MHINNVFILMPSDDSGNEEDPDRRRRREAEAERKALRTKDLPERWRLMPLPRKKLENDAGELALWLGFAGALAALFLAGWAVLFVERQSRTVDFMPVTGVVVESDLEKSRSRAEEPADETYQATVRYEYLVNGEPYTNDRIRYGLATIDGDAAREFHRAHPTGAPVTVYHDPANPERSVLQTGLHRHDYLALWLGIGGLCLVIGWWMLLIPHRMAANGRRPAGGTQIRTYGPCINARLTTLPPVAVGLGAAIMIITAGMVLLIATHPDRSPIVWVLFTLLIATGLGALAGWIWSWLYRAERHWLTIDTEGAFIVTQGMGEVVPPRRVPLNEITAITLGGFERRRFVPRPDGAAAEADAAENGTSPEDAIDEAESQIDDAPAPPEGTLVLLQVRDEEESHPFAVPAASFGSAAVAVRFADWLSGRIGRPMTWREETKPVTAAATDHETRPVDNTR